MESRPKAAWILSSEVRDGRSGRSLGGPSSSGPVLLGSPASLEAYMPYWVPHAALP